MKPRDRVFATIRKEPTDQIPWTLDIGAIEGLSPPLLNLFRNKTGYENPEEYFNYDIRKIESELTANVPGATGDLNLRTSVNSEKQKYIRERYLPDLPLTARLDEWGIGFTESSIGHFERIWSPLKEIRTRKEIEKYPSPEFIGEGIKEQIEQIKKKGFVLITYSGSIFEWSWWLRSYEELLVDMMTNKSLAEAVMDKVTNFTLEISEKLAKSGTDILAYYDDVGMQDGMMISPSLWREWVKPRWKTVFETVRQINPQVKIFFHSDGNIKEIIPDLIEIGIDILNPVQPESMNPAQIKREYGKYLTFWGTIGVQKTMPFGTPLDIKKEMKERVETVGRGGGLIIAPSNTLEPEVPWENILAFAEAVREFGNIEVCMGGDEQREGG